MIYRFAPFELDTDRFELRRDGAARPVEPQVFALLRLLVENRHRLVPREEIVETIWAGRIVSDAAVSSRIKSARQALGDDGATQRWIRTVHGQGLRFVGEVETAEVPVLAAPAAPTTALAWSREVLSRPVLAVLPFENEGGRPEDAYFVEGVAEDLITELSSWRWFPILSRNSSFDRRHAGLPASARAAVLGARYALTGRWSRAGDDARLTVELLDAASDTQIWSATFSGKTSELPDLQTKIASGVFRRIAPELTSAETRRVLRKCPEDLDSWDLTLKGLWHVHRATADDFTQALELLERAARLDPGAALPWTITALARFELALKGWTGGQAGSIQEVFRDMLKAATVATELDPSGWMGHALMSAGELWTNFAFPRARRHADLALSLNPSASMAYHFSGCIYGFAGDLDTAIATETDVYRVDPGYGHTDVVEADLGLWTLLQGDLDAARDHLDRALSFNPSNVRALQRRIALAGTNGDETLAAEAIAALRNCGGRLDENYLRASYPFQVPGHAERFHRALERAGLFRTV